MSEFHHSSNAKLTSQDALRKSQGGVLRAHGKLKGLDVFSWMQPDQEALIQFLESVPSTFFWVGNPTEIAAVLLGNPSLEKKFKSILSYGMNHTGFMLENEFEDIQGLLNELMLEIKPPGTLLFTCTDSDSEYVAMKIVAYLNLVQLT